MQRTYLVWIVLITLAQCAQAEWHFETLTTTMGTTYTNATVKRIEGEYAVLIHASGIVPVAISVLPDSALETIGLPSKRQNELRRIEIEVAKEVERNKDEMEEAAQREKDARQKETVRAELYRIVGKEDFSYCTPNGQLVVRKDYRILLLSTDATHSQMKNIAERIASEEVEVNALLVLFYWPNTETTGAYTAASATYAPNGRWADARQSAPKKLVMEYGRTVAELTPQYGSDTGLQSASRRRAIYWALVKEEDRADIAGGDYEQSKRIIAKRYGLSVSEVAKIQVEGVDKRWPIPEDPRY